MISKNQAHAGCRRARIWFNNHAHMYIQWKTSKYTYKTMPADWWTLTVLIKIQTTLLQWKPVTLSNQLVTYKVMFHIPVCTCISHDYIIKLNWNNYVLDYIYYLHNKGFETTAYRYMASVTLQDTHIHKNSHVHINKYVCSYCTIELKFIKRLLILQILLSQAH